MLTSDIALDLCDGFLAVEEEESVVGFRKGCLMLWQNSLLPVRAWRLVHSSNLSQAALQKGMLE